MPLPVIAGALRITTSGLCQGGGAWSNTWHAVQTTPSGWDLAAITGFHDTFSQLYLGPALGSGAFVMQFCATGTSIVKFSYTPLDGSSGAFEFAGALAGSNGGVTLPAEVSYVLTLRTADRGRQNRGRIYLPPFGGTSVDANGKLVAAGRDQLVVQAAAVQASLATAGAPLAVGSYGPYIGAGSPHATVITSFTMDLVADVQRSRKT
jgi:hypothetical protein